MTPPFIELPAIKDDGILSFIQSGIIDFDIKRVYFITNAKSGVIRGKHAHKKTRQAIFCLKGSFELYLEDKSGQIAQFKLYIPRYGFYLNQMVWHEMRHISKDAVILVVASEEYDPDDYIRDKEQWLEAS